MATDRDDLDARRIVAAVLAGDRDAFATLVAREEKMVFRTCYRILGDVTDAEDATQETFVNAFRSLHTWRGDGPFAAWLARIAVRISLAIVARRRPTVWLDVMEPDPQEPARRRPDDRRSVRTTMSAISRARSDDFDPAPLALRAEVRNEVRSALAMLDEPYREVLALRFFAEMSLDKIADATGRPTPTVKSHLRRGLLRLRRTLDLEGAA
jgi:RNA polymerase sigma-70 factor (ECF subfamily)